MKPPGHDFDAGSSPKRLKVLFVAGCWYPHDEQPFQGIFIRRHAEAVALDHDVAVLHPLGQACRTKPSGMTRSEWGSVHQFQLRFNTPGSRLGSQKAYFRVGRAGARLVAEGWARPDVIHFHVVPSVGLTLAVLRTFPRSPVVVTEHRSGYLAESGVSLSWLRRAYTRWLMARAGAVTTVSDYHRRALSSHGFRGDISVLPNVRVSAISSLSGILAKTSASSPVWAPKNISGQTHSAPSALTLTLYAA